MNNKETKIPENFDWEFYLEYNSDLKSSGIKTEHAAKNHFINHGLKEKRKYFDEDKDYEIKKTIEEIKEQSKKFINKSSEKISDINILKNKVIFTISTTNVFAQTKTLLDSAKKFNPEYDFIIFFLDEPSEEIKLEYNIITLDKLSIPNIHEMFDNYNLNEFCFSLKPFCFKYLFENLKLERALYFDSDILIFSKLEKLNLLFIEHDILLTPHILTPIYDDDKIPSQKSFLNSGLYNAGFIGVKNTENSLNFLNWWSYNLEKLCKVDLCEGIFVDQNWLNFVPLFFKKVGIISDVGHNVAYWNLHEREIRQINGKYIVNKNTELVFFHFSGYKFDDKVSTHSNRYTFKTKKDIVDIFLNYVELVYKNGQDEFSKIKPEIKLPNNSNGINLCGYVNQNFGLSKTCKTIKNSLDDLNLNYNINEIISPKHNYKKIINTTYKNNYDKNVLVFNPGDEFKLLPYGYMSNKYNIGLWFWELNELPKTWIKNSELFDEVWASTDYLMDVFKRSIPNRVKVKKITYPIEKPIKIDKKLAKKEFNINENDFLCLFVFDYFSDVNRKNPFAVIETFIKSFPGYKNCKLIIKSQNGEEKDIEEIENLINGDNRITHINETFDLKKINTLMNASDVYISLHRSEGFGLTIMESILLEKPVICTNYSGNVDFCKKEWCELVDYNLIPVSSELYENIYDGDKDLYWADPIVEDAKIKLLKVYNNLKHYEKMAKIGKEWILKNYNSNNFKSQIEEYLKK